MAIRELSFSQIKDVSGGDAAATRAPYTNSWGEPYDRSIGERIVDGLSDAGGAVFDFIFGELY